MFFNQYPYLNLNDLNLDYLLKTLRTLSERLENFISINTIKYANPIQWNITKQYEANTVVIDANDGTAYLSVQAVPTGVGITNTDYWTPIFTLNLLSANQNITLRDDGANVLATFASSVDDWLIWNGTLYKTIRAIAVNEQYVVGYNLTRYSVEMFINDISTEIMNIIGNLSDLETSDKTSVINAINELFDKTISIQENVNEYNVLNHGVMGDGITDNTDAINDLIDAIPDGSTLYFPAGTYLIREVKDASVSGNGMATELLYEASLGVHLQNRNSITIKGCGKDTILKGIDPVGCLYGNIINVENSNGIIIKDLTVYGNLKTHVNVCNTGNLKDEWLYGINFWKNSKNCLVDNVRCEQIHADGINLHDSFERYMINIHIRNCSFFSCGRNGIQCGKSRTTFISDCFFDKMTGAQTTGCAIDCEAHDYITENIFINNCVWTNTVQGVAFNTIRNAIVSDCYGDKIWSQARKSYGAVTDFGFGVIFNNVHGIKDAFITDKTKVFDCGINRLTVYSNIDGVQSNDVAVVDNCRIDTLVFYGNFDGEFRITNNKIGQLDIQPSYTVNGLKVLNNIIGKIYLRTPLDVDICNNVITGDYDSSWVVIISNGRTIKFNNNTVSCHAGNVEAYQMSIGGKDVYIIGNNIIDERSAVRTLSVDGVNADIINNYIDANDNWYAIRTNMSGVLLVDGNITKSVNGINNNGSANQPDAINRNYNI